MNESKTFCPLPFVHLYTQPSGHTKPCCISETIYTHNFNKESIGEVFNSEEMKKLRMDMLNGKRNKLCDICYLAEDRGEYSARQGFLEPSNNKFEIPETTDGEVPLEFQYIDIRFSNQCNFKCRTCCHDFSSSWYEPEKLLGTLAPNTNKVIKVENNFIENLKKHLNKLKKIYFAGGEPLVMPEHLDILKFVTDKELSLHLHYNSNLSTLKYKEESLFKYWNKIKENGTIYIAVSCDGLYDLGEYIRVGFNHKKFVKNIQKLKDNDISYGIQFTVSTYNIFHIFETIEQFIELDIIKTTDDISFHYAWAPDGVSVKNLHKDDKLKIINTFESNINNVTEKTKTELNNILKFMGTESGDYTEIERYNKKMKVLESEKKA
jgi:MoaA/NifB/PqqE/SkfB family radical SAM enzyme|tara:strand:- start:155 stop:1288 length:1134 start_codon:yes stop_codon:yes gene_type:complete